MTSQVLEDAAHLRLRPEVNDNIYQLTTGQKCCWNLLLSCLRPLGTVLGTGLHTSGNALRIEGAADDVVTNAGEILDTAWQR